MKYEISEQVLSGILQYLSKQPYAEVAPLIGAIDRDVQASQQLRKMKNGKDPKTKSDNKTNSADPATK